jgi:hypothetical protein
VRLPRVPRALLSASCRFVSLLFLFDPRSSTRKISDFGLSKLPHSDSSCKSYKAIQTTELRQFVFLAGFSRPFHSSKGKSLSRGNMEARITNPQDQSLSSKSRRWHGPSVHPMRSCFRKFLLVVALRIGDLQS